MRILKLILNILLPLLLTGKSSALNVREARPKKGHPKKLSHYESEDKEKLLLNFVKACIEEYIIYPGASNFEIGNGTSQESDMLSPPLGTPIKNTYSTS